MSAVNPLSSNDPSTGSVAPSQTNNETVSSLELSVDSSVLSPSNNNSNYTASAKRAGKVLGGLTPAQSQQIWQQQVQDQFDKEQVFEKEYNQEEIQDFKIEITNMNNNKNENQQ